MTKIQFKELLHSIIFWRPLPLLVSTIAILLAINVSIHQSIQTAKLAQESAARSELSQAIQKTNQDAFCGLVVSIADPTVLPSTPLGLQTIPKYRHTVEVLGCPHTPYTLPDSIFPKTQ